MMQEIKKIYNSIQSLNATKLIYLSIFIILAGFLLNGCILKNCGAQESILYKFFDNLLFIIEGAIIAATLMILMIKHPKRIVGIYASLGAIFTISFFIFPQNREAILSIIKEFFLYCVTSFILFWEVSKDKDLYYNILKIAHITFALGIIYLIILLANGENIYNLWLSRFFFFTGIFNLNSIYKNKTNRSIIISILNFIFIFITGSRTYLILYSCFAMILILTAIIKRIHKLTPRKKIIAFVIMIVVIILLSSIIINYKQICDNLFYFFAEKGVTIRVFRLLATDNFFTSNDRINIMYPTVRNLIRENWIIGLGIGGDRTALYNLYEQAGILRNDIEIDAYYSHNLFLEIYSNFGILLGTIIVGFIIYSFYKILKKKQNINVAICLFYIAILPLMLTGTIWNNIYLWGILGMMFASLQKNSKLKGKEETKNVVMLLDNCFDPDVRVYKEARYLVDNKINVEIVCLDKKNKYKDKPVENLKGIKVKRIFCRTERTTELIEQNKIISKCKYIIYFWWLLKFIYKTRRYLKKKDFDILHCHDLTMAFIGCVFFNNKKIVFDMHEYYGNNNNKIQNFIIKKITSYTQNRANWIIYVNDFQKIQCKEKNYKKLVEIPNYPKKEKFSNIEKIKSNKIRISYVGKVRDFPTLSKLIDSSNASDLINISIYGDGSEFNKLLEYAKSKGKESIMKGSYNGLEETEKIYNNTDILYSVYSTSLVNSKNWNNAMPVKSFEAIITLTPIIASKNTVLGDFVQKNNIGFVIDEKNEEEIIELFKLLESSPGIIEEKVESLRKIQYMYTWEEVSKNLDKIYTTKED